MNARVLRPLWPEYHPGFDLFSEPQLREFEGETVWLTQALMAELFQTTGTWARRRGATMDELTRSFYELKFELAFMKKAGNEFQDFFAAIMEKRHPADFIRVRPWGSVGDRKNDGYLRSERKLFQVYAPNEIKARETVAKIDEDFAGAKAFWEAHFDAWVFVHNASKGLGPSVTARLLELHANAPPSVLTWGYPELRQQVFQLGDHELASLLGPAPSRRGMLDLGLESLAPLLDQLAIMPAPQVPDLRPPPADKIRRNMLSEYVTTLLTAGMARADLVRSYFRAQPNTQDEIAASFRHRYDVARTAGLGPDAVFGQLQRFAGGEAVPSAERQCGILAVLAFFFEECDIFERDGDAGGIG